MVSPQLMPTERRRLRSEVCVREREREGERERERERGRREKEIEGGVVCVSIDRGG